MDVLRARGDSWSSADSFAVVDFDEDAPVVVDAVEAAVQPVDASEWEDLGDASSSDRMSWDLTVDTALDVVESASESSVALDSPPVARLARPSKSRQAREALIAFYLARAKQSELRSKAFVVTPPPPRPAPPVVIPLVKYEGRRGVAMREEALRLENAARAKATLEQFYRQRDEVNRKRAVINRLHEFKVYQAQCGRSSAVAGAGNQPGDRQPDEP